VTVGAGTVGHPVAEGALVASVAVFHVVDHRRVPERHHLWTHLAAGLAAVGAANRLGADGHDLGLAPDRAGAGLRHGALAGGVLAAAVVAASRLPAAAGVLDDPRAAGLGRRELARRVGLEIPFSTAVYEELVFRSALLGLALRRWRPATAVAVTSALFGLWHILPALEDREHNPLAGRHHALATVAPTVLATAAAGVALSVQRLRSGSVLAPMVSHAAVNAAALLAAAAAARRRVP
jgi:membrane protease YdiL (CAAX protease family)